MALMNLI